MIPCVRRDTYVVGVMPFFLSIFLIRKRMMNAKDTKEKERRRNHYSPPAFVYDKYNYNEKRDKDSHKYIHGLRLKDFADTLVVEELSLCRNTLYFFQRGELSSQGLFLLECKILFLCIQVETVYIYNIVLSLVFPLLAELITTLCL